MKLLLFLIASRAFAAVTDVRVEASHTQAIIRYTPSTNEVCSVQVWDMNLPIFISSASGNGTTLTITTRGLAHGLDLSAGIGQTVWIEGTGVSGWDNLRYTILTTPTVDTFTVASATSGSGSKGLVGTRVHDVNTTLFPGSDQDNRAGNISVARSRTFVVGQRLTALASNGKYYSRALQAKADGPAQGRHAFWIDCPSDATYFGAFQTNSIPLGNAAEVEVVRSDPIAPGTPMAPSFDLRGRAERLGGVALERVIEPASGMMHTNSQVPGEVAFVTDNAVSTTNASVNAPTGWTTPTNVLTDDGNSAVYSGAGKDILCLSSTYYIYASPVANYIGGSGSSYDSIRTLIKASAAGTGADAQIEVALGDAGSCSAPITDWQTIQLTGSLATYRFPASATPKAALADWISTGGAYIPSVMDLQMRFGGSLIADGTSTVTMPSAPFSVYFRGGGDAYFDWSFFNERWTSGVKIKIGAEITGGMSHATEVATIATTCASGTEYTISSYNSPISLTLGSTVSAGTNLSWCVPQSNILIRKKTTSTDNITLQYVNYDIHSSRGPYHDSGGNAKRMSETGIADASGNLGYLNWNQDNGIHWISRDTGESRRIMGGLLPARSGVWAGQFCAANEATFNAVNPAQFICVVQNLAGTANIILKVTMKWSGSGIWTHQDTGISSFAECSDPNTPVPNPCITMDILNEGHTIESLVYMRDSAFEVGKYACSMTNVALQYVAIKCLSGAQDSVGWAVIWDLTRDIANYVGNQATNPVIAAIKTTAPGNWWGGIHGFTVIGPNVAKLGIHNGFEYVGTHQTGTGPFVMATAGTINNTTDLTSCPANQWNFTQCSTIVVTSEPYDPQPSAGETGAAAEYGTVAVGQPVVFLPIPYQDPNTDYLAALSAGNWEWGRVVAKSGSAPTISLVIARSGVVAGTPSPRNWTSPFFLTLQQLTDGNLDIPEPLMMWAFLDHPTGGNAAAIGRSAYDSSHLGCTHIACVALTELGVTSYAPPIPSVVGATPPPIATPGFVGFNQKIGVVYTDGTEVYIANHGVDCAEEPLRCKFAINSANNYANVQDNSLSPKWLKVGGTTYIYKMSAWEDDIWFHAFAKGLPLEVFVGYHPVLDVSGPSCALADNSTDHYKFCFVYRDGEAWSGSKKGEVYANLPYAQKTSYGELDSSGYVCSKRALQDLGDICAQIKDPFVDQNIQYNWGLHNNMRKGQDFRKLGSSFSYVKFGGYGPVPKVFPNGKWLGPLINKFGSTRYRSQALYAKIPPTPPADSINRLNYVPVPLTVGSAPSGTVAAQVEFGYHDWSNGVGVGYGCTARREPCLATASAIPASVASLHSGPQVAWIMGDNYVVASQNPVTFNFTNHGFYDGQRVGGHYGEPQTIGFVTGDQFNWVGTTTQYTVSQQLRLSHWREDSPWLFASDGCSVGAASNATPIAVRCSAGPHNLATGSRVFISGVGGNTAANGHWTVTVTGEATFTLDTSVGNGAYTSGGTVAPGGQACASGCTITVPAMSQRVMYYRWKYQNSAGTVIATSSVETMVTP